MQLAPAEKSRLGTSGVIVTVTDLLDAALFRLELASTHRATRSRSPAILNAGTARRFVYWGKSLNRRLFRAYSCWGLAPLDRQPPIFLQPARSSQSLGNNVAFVNRGAKKHHSV
ncbi:MAG: hypothetical protein KDB27_11800 [Planctomycetales bacterium]|nr:hypothetical protein [Planctomycetales bacterium]